LAPVAAVALLAMIALGGGESQPSAATGSEAATKLTEQSPAKQAVVANADRVSADAEPEPEALPGAVTDATAAAPDEGQSDAADTGASAGSEADAQVAGGSPDPDPEPEPAPTWARVCVDSTPPGARVMRGAVEICTTPCDEPMASSNEPVALSVVHEGFRAASLELILAPGGEVHRKVHLEKLKPAARARPRRRAPATPERRLRTIRGGEDEPAEKPARKLRPIRIDEEEAP
jgi:hypothetical protein